MPDIPLSTNRPVSSTRPIRRGSRVMPAESREDRQKPNEQAHRQRRERRNGDRRKRTLAVRMERRSSQNRRGGRKPDPTPDTTQNHAAPVDEGKIGKNINTIA